MLKRLAILTVLTVVEVALRGQSPSVGVNPCSDQKQESKDYKAKSKTDQRGTPCSPLVVDIKKAEKTNQEAADDAAEKNRKEFIDRWTLNLAFAVAASALLQVVGLAIQIVNLRQTNRAYEG